MAATKGNVMSMYGKIPSKAELGYKRRTQHPRVRAALNAFLQLVPGNAQLADLVVQDSPDSFRSATAVVRSDQPISPAKLYRAALDNGYDREQRNGELKVVVGDVQIFFGSGKQAPELQIRTMLWL